MIGTSRQWTPAVGQSRGDAACLDLGAERHLTTAHAPIHRRISRDYCTVLHHSASRSRPNTLRSTSRSLQKVSLCRAAATRYRTNIACPAR
jgi:hypothetical protein